MAWPTDSARTKNWGTEILTDSDLETQLDLLHTYFNDCLDIATGHTHDGSTNNHGPKLSLTAAVSGTLPVANGGTGLASYTQGDVPYASASTTISKLGAGTAGQALTTGGAAANPSFAGMTTQGDVEYHNGTTRTRLAAGTSGQFLKTQGAGANPTWASQLVPSSIKDYGTSASSSTTKTLDQIHICYGTLSVNGNSNASLSNLPFSSSSSYSLTGTFGTATDATEAVVAVQSSGSAATLYNNDNQNQTIHWIAIGT